MSESKEVTSCDTVADQSEDQWPFPNITSLFGAFKRNLFRNPNQDFLGTTEGYVTYRMAADMAEHLSYGIVAMEMISEAEGLKLIGLMSRNRPESFIT